MDPREVQIPTDAQDLRALQKRVADLERIVARTRRVEIIDDLLDVESPYQGPSVPPGGASRRPEGGDVLTFDDTRSSEYGGLWVPKPMTPLGPYVQDRAAFSGYSGIIGTDELLDGAIDGLWLVSIALETEFTVGNTGAIEVWDSTPDQLAGNRFTISTWSESRASCSVAFLWWPECSESLAAEGYARDSSGSDLDAHWRWRSIRLIDTPEGIVGNCPE